MDSGSATASKTTETVQSKSNGRTMNARSCGCTVCGDKLHVN